LCALLAGQMLLLGSRAASAEDGAEMARQALTSGSALQVFQSLVSAQGGPPGFTGQGLAEAPVRHEVLAPQGGWITHVDALALGVLARDMGAGRAVKTDQIDPAVGIEVWRKAGDEIRAGDILATLHLAHAGEAEVFAPRYLAAVTIGNAHPSRRPLVHAVL
jgi:thymidine phosphorylase